MADKKNKNKPYKPGDNQARKRTRTLQIILAVFSIILILSMVLSLAAQ